MKEKAIQVATQLPKDLLEQIYDEATLLDDEGLQSLCPSYTELKHTHKRYENYQLLGKGSLKEVYRAYDNQTKRWVALALLGQDRGPDYYDLFIHEAWLVAGLNHPNIIKVHDTGVSEEGRPFFTMDLRSNKSLSDRVHDAGSQDIIELLAVFNKVCDAVSYAHSQGVVHLDLKPENIQCDTFGHVLVCDWGIGKKIDDENNQEVTLPLQHQEIESMTLMGQVKGSLGYMSPEQILPDSKKDESSDIYALGCILHFMLTKFSPFLGNIDQVLQATLESKFTAPRERYPKLNIPYSLEAIVLKATQLDKSDRYKSVADLQQDINSYLTGYATQAEHSGFFREAALFFKRNKISSVVAAGALVLITSITVLFTQYLGSQKTRLDQIVFEADQLSDNYQTLLISSKKMAARIVQTAIYLKQYNLFDSPVETVNQADKLLDTAIKLDPGNQSAITQKFYLYGIRLNTKTALKYLKSKPSKVAGSFSQVLECFSEFNFTEKERPTIEQFTEYIEAFYPTNKSYIEHLERTIAYDCELREYSPSYIMIIETFIKHINGVKNGIKLTLNEKNELWKLTLEP